MDTLNIHHQASEKGGYWWMAVNASATVIQGKVLSGPENLHHWGLCLEETGMSESKWIWSPIKRHFYNIVFTNNKNTFKPAGWSRDWPDKQTLERNIYEGSLKVTSVDDGQPIKNCSVPLSIAQQEFVWGTFVHRSEQIVYTDANGVANYKINPKPGSKFIHVNAIIPVTERQRHEEKMIQSEESVDLKAWSSISDSFIAVKPIKPIYQCDETPELKIQYNLLYNFSRFDGADDAIANLQLKYIVTSAGRLLGGGDVASHTRRSAKQLPKFIQRGTTNQILRGYMIMNVNTLSRGSTLTLKLAEAAKYEAEAKCDGYCDSD